MTHPTPLKFKIGDKVKITDCRGDFYEVRGTVGSIKTEAISKDRQYEVFFEVPLYVASYGSARNTWYLYENELELIPIITKRSIRVIRI